MNPRLQFLERRVHGDPLNVLILAADHRAAATAAGVAARVDASKPGGPTRVARHLFADVDGATDWSVIAKEVGRADVLIVSFGDESDLPDRLRRLVDYANRMRSKDFLGVVALSQGWISGATRRWLANLTDAEGFEHWRKPKPADIDRLAA